MRNYIRKTNRAAWHENQMKQAIEAVQEKQMSIRKAVSVFKVPFESLRRRCRGELKQAQPYTNKLGSKRTVLTEKQEQELAQFVIEMDNSFHEFTINELRKVAFQFCERKKIADPFNAELKMAGRDFVQGFLKRQKIISL